VFVQHDSNLDKRQLVEVRQMRTQRNGEIPTAEEAESTIVEAVQTAKDTVVGLGALAAEAGSAGGEFARNAGRQVTAAAQSAYGTGSDALDIVEGFARENFWGSVLIAGALGYGLACLVKSTR
jgi:hypothetical protein